MDHLFLLFHDGGTVRRSRRFFTAGASGLRPREYSRRELVVVFDQPVLQIANVVVAINSFSWLVGHACWWLLAFGQSRRKLSRRSRSVPAGTHKKGERESAEMQLELSKVR